MTDPSVPHPGADREGAAPKRLPALFRVANYFRAHPGERTVMEQLTLYTVAAAMNAEGVCALLETTIATRIGRKIRTVRAALHRLSTGPAPLLIIHRQKHRCNRYELVSAPKAFAAGRDQAAVLAFTAEARARCAARKRPGPARRRPRDEDDGAARALATLRAQAAALAPTATRDEPPSLCTCGRLILRRVAGDGTVSRYDVDPRSYQAAGPHTCPGAVDLVPEGPA